jgi:predicted nucleic acid-binding protein
MSVLRRLVAAGNLPLRRADLALRDLLDLPMQRARPAPLLARCWELRANLTAYDAAYVALAEALDAPLLTGDRRVASAPGIRCQVRLLG